MAGLRSPAPRRAPCRPRAPSSRPAHSPAGSRRALPRPPAAGGGGGARPASRARRAHPGVRARGSRPPPQAARGRCGGVPGSEGRRPAGRTRRRARGRLRPHRGGASEDGHELRRQARRARARGAARLRSQPARRLRSPQNAWSSPGPRPSPLAPRRRRPPAHPGAGWCPEHGESALPGRPASRPPPPCPPRGWSGPLPHPRPALTCSLAQPQTLAVGSPRSLHAGRGRDGRGARGHGGWQCVLDFFFFRVWGEGGVGGNRARP